MNTTIKFLTVNFLNLSIILIISLEIIHAQGFGYCNFGNYPFGDCTISVPPKKPSEGGAGALGYITIPSTFTEVNLFGSPLTSNGTCKIGYQLFDSKCYPCDPNIGYLEFNPNDRSVLCVKCNNEFQLINKTCYAKDKDFTLFKKISKFGLRINPQNAINGLLLVLILSIMIGYWLFGGKKKEDKKIKEGEDEDEL